MPSIGMTFPMICLTSFCPTRERWLLRSKQTRRTSETKRESVLRGIEENQARNARSPHDEPQSVPFIFCGHQEIETILLHTATACAVPPTHETTTPQLSTPLFHAFEFLFILALSSLFPIIRIRVGISAPRNQSLTTPLSTFPHNFDWRQSISHNQVIHLPHKKSKVIFPPNLGLPPNSIFASHTTLPTPLSLLVQSLSIQPLSSPSSDRTPLVPL
mmetsp:Transcript_1345/g.4646  ORF Transcript_1345/g.4646 Transcript_1345/m.4646 type:complete len:216 (+) Transcript_1345:970-1617(+)